MLVLTRKTDESIRIGDDVEIIVVSVRGNRVRLGIRADREIPVRRAECHPYGTSERDEQLRQERLERLRNAT